MREVGVLGNDAEVLAHIALDAFGALQASGEGCVKNNRTAHRNGNGQQTEHSVHLAMAQLLENQCEWIIVHESRLRPSSKMTPPATRMGTPAIIIQPKKEKPVRGRVRRRRLGFAALGGGSMGLSSFRLCDRCRLSFCEVERAFAVAHQQIIERAADLGLAICALPFAAFGQDLAHLNANGGALGVEAELVGELFLDILIPLLRNHRALHPFAVEATFAIEADGVHNGRERPLIQPRIAQHRPDDATAPVQHSDLRRLGNLSNAEAPHKRFLGCKLFGGNHLHHRRLADFFFQLVHLAR